MKTHQHLTTDELLQRLAGVPGIQLMSDDELRALYCEGLVGGFQQTIDTQNKNNSEIEGEATDRRLSSAKSIKVGSAIVKRDEKWPNMWRVHLPNGAITDLANLTRGFDKLLVACDGERALPVPS